jgi:GNAT superfamily N-acetyltransferase
LTAELRIRPAGEDDVPLIFSLIVELAEYERAPEQVTGSPDLLREGLFGASPTAEAVIAEAAGDGGAPEPLGFALFHGTFSTWECRPGLWLEDLYVRPAHRRGGVGLALIQHVARVAVERDCSRLNWVALDWNAPALSFYEKLGAEALDDWRLLRLSGEALRRFADDDWTMTAP